VATSRKQSGRRPLKILLRIVCHFTSEAVSERTNGPRSRVLARPTGTGLTEDSFVVQRHGDSVRGVRRCHVSPGAPPRLPGPHLSGGTHGTPGARELTVLRRLG